MQQIQEVDSRPAIKAGIAFRPSLIEELDRICAGLRMSRSQFVCAAVADRIEKEKALQAPK